MPSKRNCVVMKCQTTAKSTCLQLFGVHGKPQMSKGKDNLFTLSVHMQVAKYTINIPYHSWDDKTFFFLLFCFHLFLVLLVSQVLFWQNFSFQCTEMSYFNWTFYMTCKSCTDINFICFYALLNISLFCNTRYFEEPNHEWLVSWIPLTGQNTQNPFANEKCFL